MIGFTYKFWNIKKKKKTYVNYGLLYSNGKITCHLQQPQDSRYSILDLRIYKQKNNNQQMRPLRLRLGLRFTSPKEPPREYHNGFLPPEKGTLTIMFTIQQRENAPKNILFTI